MLKHSINPAKNFYYIIFIKKTAYLKIQNCCIRTLFVIKKRHGKRIFAIAVLPLALPFLQKGYRRSQG